MSEERTTAEIEIAIDELSVPRGDPGDVQTRDSALEFLLTHADRAHPRLLAAVDPTSGGPAPLVLALARFGRPESVPVLNSILRNAADTRASIAARALAEHPLATALEALLDALSSTREATATAAADGLLLRNDRTACPELLKRSGVANVEIRYHIVQAAAGLGCMRADVLEQISRQDPDRMVRELAARLRREAAGNSRL